MKTTIINFEKIIFFLCFFSGLILFAQNKVELDTSRAFQFIIPPEILEYQFNDPEIIQELNRLSFNKMLIKDSSSVWMQTRMMIGSLSGQSNLWSNSSSKLLSPLYNSYLETQKLATLKAILGSVQVGAVAYLAYKHIKKYGFLKKK